MRKEKAALLFAGREWLDKEFDAYCSKSFEQLKGLVENDEGREIEIHGMRMAISAWADSETDGRIGVLVEVRRMRFLGWSQVQVRGFYATQDGATFEMKENDLWAHGY